MHTFQTIAPSEMQENIFKLIGKDTFLLTAGQPGDFNTMTCAWGGMGIAWGRDVATVFVRHSRHTYTYIEREPYFSLAWFNEDYRSALQICGHKSGRDTDKVAETGLIPRFDTNAPYFDQARLIMICRKLYGHDINLDNFIDPAASTTYQSDALHRVYTAQIEQVLLQK